MLSVTTLLNSVLFVVQLIIVAVVLLNTSLGTGIISVYCVSFPLGGIIVTPEVELVSGVGLMPEPATNKVYVFAAHRTQVKMSNTIASSRSTPNPE